MSPARPSKSGRFSSSELAVALNDLTGKTAVSRGHGELTIALLSHPLTSSKEEKAFIETESVDQKAEPSWSISQNFAYFDVF